MHSGTEPDERAPQDPPGHPGHRRRIVAGDPHSSACAPQPDPLTDTFPAGGLHKFDLGMVPASVTPPRTWRHAAWFAITTSAAALGGLVLAGSLLVNSPVRLDGQQLPSMPRGRDYPPVPQPLLPPSQDHGAESAPPQHLFSAVRPTAPPVDETQQAPLSTGSAPQPTPPPEAAAPAPAEPPAPAAEPPAPAEPPAGFPEQPALFDDPAPALSAEEQHRPLFSGELPALSIPSPQAPFAECAGTGGVQVPGSDLPAAGGTAPDAGIPDPEALRRCFAD
ncbi:hypothetical protein IQ251_11550 [Saccharopolyspora sp. HNM0983]|uniref:Uncharacterized protein n=1 Tax=Saccharopolyspora montiporae TaxID=2781240 RepID=A0A929BA61_9PSEU|nr:hypothetical protein [Saccharopolyspora sp. HNM0983]MBE9375076.1 hypothetical protein [Saccharopolyspora sp. HNM0983]